MTEKNKEIDACGMVEEVTLYDNISDAENNMMKEYEKRRVRNLKIYGLKFEKGVTYGLIAISFLCGCHKEVMTIFEAPETYLVGESIIDPEGIIQEKKNHGVEKPDENRVVETELSKDGTMVENIYDASNASKGTLVSLLKDTDGNLKEQLGEPIETHLNTSGELDEKKIAYVYEILNSEPVVSRSEKGQMALSIASFMLLIELIYYCIEIKTGSRYKVLRDKISKKYPDEFAKARSTYQSLVEEWNKTHGEKKITPLDPQKKKGIFK